MGDFPIFDRKPTLMRYKGYTWTNNPAKCSYECERDIIVHKYPELLGWDIEDLFVKNAIITGSGTFFGPTAYDQWKELLWYMKDNTGPGEFYHPIFPDVTSAILKKLSASVEPIEDFVAYDFEFWQNAPPAYNESAIVVVTATDIITPSVVPSSTYNDYVVQNGDSLWNILVKSGVDPTTWPDVGRYNNLPNPHLIYPKQVLKIPKG